MAAREHMRTLLKGRSAQAPGLMRHGPPPTLPPPNGVQLLETLSPLETLERKIQAQSVEMERLTVENHRLAATHVALRQDLINAQQEVQRLNAHIRSIQTESDIQLRVLLDKIAKYEVDIRAGDGVKMDLQKAHGDAQSLVIARQELIALIERKNDELQKARFEAEKLPLLHAELGGLIREHQRLRTTFEYEKSMNVEQVRQMQTMEKNLMSMARELEKLRAEVAKVEKNAIEAPYPHVGMGGYMHGDPSYMYQVPGGPPYDNGSGSAGHQIPMGGPMPIREGVSPFSGVNSVSINGMAGTATPGVNWGTAPYAGSRNMPESIRGLVWESCNCECFGSGSPSPVQLLLGLPRVRYPPAPLKPIGRVVIKDGERDWSQTRERVSVCRISHGRDSTENRPG